MEEASSGLREFPQSERLAHLLFIFGSITMAHRRGDGG